MQHLTYAVEYNVPMYQLPMDVYLFDQKLGFGVVGSNSLRRFKRTLCENKIERNTKRRNINRNMNKYFYYSQKHIVSAF